MEQTNLLIQNYLMRISALIDNFELTIPKQEVYNVTNRETEEGLNKIY